jgi:hypothetical protein
MSAPWSGTATESVPQLPPGTIAQANALSLPSSHPPSISPAAVHSETKPMSNGSIAPGALPGVAAPRPAVPAPGVNSNGVFTVLSRAALEVGTHTNAQGSASCRRAPTGSHRRRRSRRRMGRPGRVRRDADSVLMPVPASTQAPPPPASAAAGPSAPRPPAAMLPMGRGQGIDMRAEEEAARRAARSAVGGAKFAGSGSRAKQTDLLGEQVLRARLHRIGERSS